MASGSQPTEVQQSPHTTAGKWLTANRRAAVATQSTHEQQSGSQPTQEQTIRLRQDCCIQVSTYQAEQTRLRLQAEAMPTPRIENLMKRKIERLLANQYGLSCWVCNNEITVEFDDSQPRFGQVDPDGNEMPYEPRRCSPFCAECWPKYKRAREQRSDAANLQPGSQPTDVVQQPQEGDQPQAENMAHSQQEPWVT